MQCLGQAFDCEPLQPRGTIPADFLQLSSEKYESDRETISRKNTSRKDRKAREQFFLETSFVLDNTLLSGKILFNDPISRYIGKVADEVLKDDPALRQQLRFFAVKSAAVNAFATDRGLILVNVGLIAQLANEAQLAFILAHEVVHFQEDHAMEKFEESLEIKEGQGIYRDLSLDDRILATSRFSREVEEEADEEGFDLYLTTNYSLDEIAGVFDVLQYSCLPFDEVKFDPAFFETAHLHFPEAYVLEEVQDINFEADEVDERSTHPGVDERREKVMSRLVKHSNEGRQLSLVSQEEFERVRELARFELSRIHLLNGNYGAAIYNSYLLLENYPDHLYLKKNIAKALRGLVAYANEHDEEGVLADPDDIEGESQRLYFLLDELCGDEEELNAVALGYAWRLKMQHPDDRELEMICNDLFTWLVEEHYDDKGYFHNKHIYEVRKELQRKQAELEKDSSALEAMDKYEKIRYLKELEVLDDDKDGFIRYAFVDLFEDAAFESEFDRLLEEAEAETESGEAESMQFITKIAEDRLIAKRGYVLGIGKVAIVDSFYIKVDLRREKSFEYLRSENAELDFIGRLNKLSGRLDLEAVVLDAKNLQPTETQQFQDIAFLREWIIERLDHEEGMDFSSLGQDRVAEIIDRYGTKHFCLTGAITTQHTNHLARLMGYYSIILPPMLLLAIPTLATPNIDTFVFNFVFNLETAEIEMIVTNEVERRDRNDILNSIVYHHLHQIKHQETDFSHDQARHVPFRIFTAGRLPARAGERLFGPAPQPGL